MNEGFAAHKQVPGPADGVKAMDRGQCCFDCPWNADIRSMRPAPMAAAAGGDPRNGRNRMYKGETIAGACGKSHHSGLGA